MWVVSGHVGHFQSGLCAFYVPMKGLNVLSADLGQIVQQKKKLFIPKILFKSTFKDFSEGNNTYI